MDELSRRAACSLIAVSVGSLSGCAFANSDPTKASSAPKGREKIVSSRKGLESAFKDLSPGETIYISEENAPYRTTEWLDIDVDGVTVRGPGTPTLVHPADGANVGGIRIGHNERCRRIDVAGVGYRGNAVRGSDAERLHGIAVEDASDVTLEHNQIRHTYPREHGTGGSGISVSRRCSNVRVSHNRIHQFGDRGIQLGGRRHVVSGNVVTDGLDRPIACDMWYPERKNSTAQTVSVFGNLVGNSAEGSLIGIARSAPLGSNGGFANIFGNVGFGSHKAFCHVRGPASVQNTSIQNNVSVQRNGDSGAERGEPERFAGISVDVDGARNLSIRNNALHGYSGHGIRVTTRVTSLAIQQNRVSDAGLAGIWITSPSDGLVTGNVITDPNEVGIHLKGPGVDVRQNYVRGAGTSGIVAGKSNSRRYDVAANVIVANGQQSGSSAPAVRVRDSGVRVRGNTIARTETRAIAEADTAEGNLYEDNWATGDRPWKITSPTSRVNNHTPPIGVHRGVSAAEGGDAVTVEFDRPYATHPRLSFGRAGGGIRERSYETDEDDNYVGVTLRPRNAGAVLDVFVDDG